MNYQFSSRISLISAIFTILLLFGCEKKPDAGWQPDMEASAQSQACYLSRQLTPAKSAELMVAWLADAPFGVREYASAMTHSIDSAYEAAGKGKGAFSRSLDSLALHLPAGRRARLFAVSSIPESLAGALKRDSSNREFIRLVEEAYRPDSTLHARFVRAVNRR